MKKPMKPVKKITVDKEVDFYAIDGDYKTLSDLVIELNKLKDYEIYASDYCGLILRKRVELRDKEYKTAMEKYNKDLKAYYLYLASKVK